MKKYLLLLPVIIVAYTLTNPVVAFAHQIPNTIVLLSVHDSDVKAEIKLPLSELGLAMDKDLTTTPKASVQANNQEITDYLINHIHPTTSKTAWTVKVDGLKVETIESDAVGTYMVATAAVTLRPPAGISTRVFSFDYDAIIKEVPGHIVFVSIKEDWSNGVINESDTKQVGIIQADGSSGTIAPLAINLADGGIWKGFGSMVQLGMSHIREGTDHLLFLFTLLLPAPLIALARRWGRFGGTKRSLLNIVKITTAFTVGHSLTLIISTLIHLNIPAWPIEALIAVSIIVSALHAIKPMFAGREVFIAAGFGLIHGMSQSHRRQ
jgi:hypothetical protein